MTGSDRSLRTLLAHATDWAHEHLWNNSAGSETEEEEPLRAALFSSDQMVAHGKLLAGRHRLAQQHRPDRLLARLASNERVLENVARQLRQAVAKDRPVTPASEWLLDNMYLIDEEIRTARRHLPHGYSRELPRLAEASPETDGTTPRVYDLALEAIAHADGRLSRGTLSRFVAAYQSVQPLKLGELWAFPIMLRLALIENLRRVAVRVAIALDERDMAETWASRMLQAAEERPSDLILVIADMARSDPTLSSAFVAEFARRLQGQGAALALPLTWMEQRLSDVEETIEHLVHLESQKQAASQVSVSNSIGSLRLLGATHWPEFVETLSSVEQILRSDPLGIYGRMDFGTRDTYRHAVESVAKASSGDEPAVARKAIELAAAAAERLGTATREMGDDDREAHVGYWLIGNGRPALDAALNARRTRLLRRPGHSPLPAYIGGIVAFSMLMSLGPILQAAHELDLQVWSPKGLVLLLLLMLATSQLALSLVNWIVTLSVTPEALPRMDYALGIDPRARTLVAVPTLLGKHADVDTLVDALEVRFLANRDPHLQFALLTDLRDARQETLPEDDDLVDYAEIRINALNKRYGESGDNAHCPPSPFLLLHRPRRWNATENVWMGRERKRGKLADLNALLRGRPDADKAFARIVGDTLSLQDVRYVITLDSDTQLPRESAAEMVSAMAHPLNRPRFGTGVKKDVVVEGYGILQPRVGLNLPSVGRSGYARMFGGEPGIDPYTRAVSDVYQDLLGEGSFVGKGIYDVDAFERATHDSMPENRILSHDLIEGCYARSGLLSDVQLLEDTPSRYSVDMARRHRWVRGDWQLIGWLRRRLHALPGAPRNPLSTLSKWKLFDNLRRSLVPAALIALAVLGWARLPEPFMWTLRVIVIVGIVPFAAHVMGLARAPINWVNAAPSPRRLLPIALQLLQLVHTLACLPTEAVATLDAIARTIWRMVRGRRLLEWTASADVRSRHAPGTINALRDNLRALWAGPTAAVLITALLAVVRPWAIAAAAPLLVLWLLSPLIVWWADRPLTPPHSELNAVQRRFLRRVARRTWGFFEAYVGAEDNHLPPDNVQFHPVARIAHRTSPTNIGFSLLANLTARDSGFITLDQMLTRIAATVTTLERLERHRGHFYNWYDTQSLLPLAPRYVSSVDSGNLVAQLMTLRMGLLALPSEVAFSPLWCQGVADLLGLVREALPAGPHVPTLDRADKIANAACIDLPPSAAKLQAALESLEAMAREVLAAVQAALSGDTRRSDADEDTGEALRWAQALVTQCEAGRAELTALGGLALPIAPDASPAAFEVAARAPLPTLGVLASLAIGEARVYLDRIDELARRVDALTEQEQAFLYDDRRHLMAIGFNVDERTLDAGYYDLLASEARLGIFTAIARGQLPQESWFALGRLLTAHDGNPVLMSWSGSMFEYLMPPLIMPNFEQTLLDETCRAAVRRQIDYGRERGVPWGISESGYNATDTALNYQYRAFGVPGLGLKRGLGDELVIAPYATAMATIVEPVAACANLQRLQSLGAAGEFGFYEAVDYTPMRVPRGQTKAVVRSFMAHHQGMSLLAIEQALGHSRMQQRFASDRSVQATMMLLHERVPKDVMPIVAEATMEPSAPRSVSATTETPLRLFTDAQTPTPEVQLLSNGSYHVMVTQAGGGYSRYKDMAVTRWREDATRDEWGSYAYLRDVDTGEYWSTAFQPTGRKATDYQAIFTEGRAEFRRRDAGIDTHTEIAVSPEDAIELRRIRIKNTTRRVRTIEVTSYCEVVLMTPAADVQHPAFGKLFVQTELVEGLPALLANRRPRAEKDPSPWMFHLMAVHAPRGEGNVSPVTHETDRARFIGRGGSVRAPAAMFGGEALSNSQGSVLDPVASSRCAITLEPDQTVIVDLVIGVGDQRADCLTLIEKYRDRRLAERVFELAWTHSQVLLRQLNASEGDAQMYARLAGAVLFSQGALRADPSIIRQNRRGQSGLWGYAISGDLPIVLVQISDVANLELVRQLVMAHAWWRLKGLAVDLVIWNEERDVYRQRLHEQVMGLIAAGVEAHVVDRPGGIFVRHADQIPQEDRILLLSVARAVLSDRLGSLAEQLGRRLRTERRTAPKSQARPGIGPDRRLAPFVPTRNVRPDAAPAQQRVPTGDLALFNGYGGYSKEGREYVVAPPAGVRTPAPWANVIANPDFGTVVSESGAAYTWAENAHEWRLTPWHNDPVSDPSGETFYLRDEETGVAWTPNGVALNPDGTPGRAAVARHGFGYSIFEQHAQGIRSELKVFCAIDAPVKFSMLTIRNDSGRARRISVTGYVEWVLGSLRPSTAPHIVTDHVDDGPAFARNPYSGDHADYMGFFDVDPEHQLAGSMTCDRTEFVGRNGNLLEPMALRRAGLSGRAGAALDPCAAFQVPIDLAEGELRTVVFRLGMGKNHAESERVAMKYRGDAVAQAEFDRVVAHWAKTLGAVQVRTPDASLNALANGWLVYQTIACRLWARSGYYQSGGAFGFRDQLQDAMALVHTRPELLRAQLLLAASRQFEEGDVQHWWHPPQGRGVRTHISDDYLWLPLGLCRYIEATGDLAVLDVQVNFIEGRPLPDDAESYFDMPNVSHKTASLYQHAALAVRHGLRLGSHGLPLIGAGDWNDGMNLIGEHGKGESVWMAFFVCEVLREFAKLARTHDDDAFALTCVEMRDKLAASIDANAWDGDWYRRAYFDDGTPLGTATGVECQIDSIAQSWSVLSGIAPRERAKKALDSLAARLVNPQQRIVKLLDPPFNGKGPNPGYISGYVPGVRENGGQYTHGAIWAAMAFAASGDARRSWDIVDMINPVNHSRTPAEVAVYKVEPYVMSADVYSVAPHTGRGGWSWYTGSAGWMYRLLVEAVLGLRLEVVDGQATLLLDPRIPPHWTSFEVDYVHKTTFFRLQFDRSGHEKEPQVTLDGRALGSSRLPLHDDGRQHSVQIALPSMMPVPTGESSELLL